MFWQSLTKKDLEFRMRMDEIVSSRETKINL